MQKLGDRVVRFGIGLRSCLVIAGVVVLVSTHLATNVSQHDNTNMIKSKVQDKYDKCM